MSRCMFWYNMENVKLHERNILYLLKTACFLYIRFDYLYLCDYLLFIRNFFNIYSRSAHNSHSKSLLHSPQKLYTSTPSLSHKKSTKTPKEKRRSSKTDLLSTSGEKAATQWYTSDSDSVSSSQLTNGSATIFELTQEVHFYVKMLCSFEYIFIILATPKTAPSFRGWKRKKVE